jgi:hypothetical protein
MMTAQQLQESSVQHSNIVGGSTAKRVISCPGSVKLVQKMPPQPSSVHADRGTMLHEAISTILSDGTVRAGMYKHKDQLLTQELYDEKIVTALEALDEIDPDGELVYEVETRVGFGDLLPGVFGSTDLVGRIGNRAVVLDWKFGDGVVVDAVENAQLMFYAAAAMRTEKLQWAFNGADEIECVIVQPPVVRRWTTTVGRIKQFEQELVSAVKTALRDDAPLAQGDHCRWCAAKPICPQMTGAVDRALKQQLINLDVDTLGRYLHNADLLEDWIKDLRALAFGMLEKNIAVPGYKLVNKQARRKWTDESKAKQALLDMGLKESVVVETAIMSPAQAEKALKKRFSELPEDLIKSESSGTTLAPEDDPRPAVQSFIGLSKALSKL